MKLGIVVAYLFEAEHEPLFHLHLRQIEKCTLVPYVIYCSVNRLADKYRQRLAEYPQVRAFEFQPTQLRGMHEHSCYLDQLIPIAVEDGATHIATLHLDSFPIRVGWIEQLAARLTDTVVIATLDRINTACLAFGRDFYLRYRPSMVVSKSIQATPEFRNYIRTCHPEQHSGTGYGFAAFTNNLSWYSLSLTKSYDQYACIYGDIMFHLVGSIRLQPNSTPDADTSPSLLSRGLLRGADVGRVLVPAGLRSRLRARFTRSFDRLIDKPRTAIEKRRYDAVAHELLQAPDVFLNQLRGRS